MNGFSLTKKKKGKFSFTPLLPASIQERDKDAWCQHPSPDERSAAAVCLDTNTLPNCCHWSTYFLIMQLEKKKVPRGISHAYDLTYSHTG